jgi:hypothetical protein
MQLKGQIIKLTITKEKKNLSLMIRIENECSGNTIQDIRALKGTTQRYNLVNVENSENSLYFDGEIHSINLIQGLTLYAPVDVSLLLKALNSMGKPLYIRFTTEMEKELKNLLNAAARKEDTVPEEILCRLTTYIKDGITRPGKRSVHSVSEGQQRVVVSKLHKLLSEPARS